MRQLIESREGTLDTGVSVFSEIGKLRKLLLWGPPASEAVLGQVLPADVSLFYENYNVAKARQEHLDMTRLVVSQGVEPVLLKEHVYKAFRRQVVLPSDYPASISQLSTLIKNRARVLMDFYGTTDGSALNTLDAILDEEAMIYGEEEAIFLNWLTSLGASLPMANIMFARDQSNVLGSRVVMSNMRWDIRKPEVVIYKKTMECLGLTNQFVDISEGTMEGGDMMILGDVCYIGVGGRTSLAAAGELVRKHGTNMASNGIELVVVFNEDLDRNLVLDHPGKEQITMHLDTFWTPINDKLVLACTDEVNQRVVLKPKVVDGVVSFSKVSNFADFLDGKGIQIIGVSREDQKNYATNLLHLGDNVVIVPLLNNYKVIKGLQQNGVEVLSPDIVELVKGYGAVHCLSASLVRDRI